MTCSKNVLSAWTLCMNCRCGKVRWYRDTGRLGVAALSFWLGSYIDRHLPFSHHLTFEKMNIFLQGCLCLILFAATCVRSVASKIVCVYSRDPIRFVEFGLSQFHCLFEDRYPFTSFCCLSPGTLLTLSVELMWVDHGLFSYRRSIWSMI